MDRAFERTRRRRRKERREIREIRRVERDRDAVGGIASVSRAARRREARPTRRKIDRGIANRFAGERAARRACQCDTRQSAASGQRNIDLHGRA